MRLVLIDGNAIVHRAYHALPPLTTKDGKLVNAVYGFTSMLLKVIGDLKPSHIAVAFDRPEKTFRQQMFADYQAQRPEMEDELARQIPIVKKVIKAMKIPIFEKAGYEADDIIGTIAKRVSSETQNLKVKKKKDNQATEIIIVTGDRDILQLVDNVIKVYMPIKGLSQAKLFDIKQVEEKYGINPSQIVDFKALVGDPSDNYRGVFGVGPKAAQNLLSRYKTLENLYKHIDEIDNKNIRERLKKGKNDALMAKKLATIVIDVPLNVNEQELKLGNIANTKVAGLFKQLQFKSLFKRIRNLGGKGKIDKKKQLKLI